MNIDNFNKVIDDVCKPDNLDFFNTMTVDELNTWESLYVEYLQRTENDINYMTDNMYTKEELKNLYNMSNINLNKISKVKQNKQI